MEMNRSKEREVEGYRIIQTVKTPYAEFLLGQNKNMPSYYATWYNGNHDSGLSTIQGHYFTSNDSQSNLLSAYHDLYSRALSDVNQHTRFEEPAPKIGSIIRTVNGQNMQFELTDEERNGVWNMVEQQNVEGRFKELLHYRIGRMFYDGYGTAVNYPEAFKWLKKAADEGNHLSEFVVGKMLCNGMGTERDTAAGAEYLTRAANSGNEYAQNYLDNRTSWEHGCVVKLVGSVGRLLSENLESSRAAISECSSAVFGHGDLSKEQIRELILKKQDKENTADSEAPHICMVQFRHCLTVRHLFIWRAK